jgi:predicted ATPase/DNA-binding winged helix-turn-helix (wHTH) protein
VRLGSRAFDILAALVERAGEVVGKEELIARAWPQTFVEEANLKIQVSALRRALGDGQSGNRYVVTVIGRGYNFVAPVRIDEPSRTLPHPTAPAVAVHNLPLAVTRMIGRAEAEEALISRLSHQRLVTIVGPGGIGKTTAALAVAERVTAEYEDGVWLIDLASLGDARLVPSAVATVLGLQTRTEDPAQGLVGALRDSRMLLLLDNCEHVIDEVASLATALLSGAKDVDILATSREPLRVAGENEYRLGPLESPQASSRLTAAEAAAFPAVQLFVERVTAIVEDFALTDENAPSVVKICSGLDGLPLAIEFAAPGVEVLGLEGLAARLKDSLPLLGSRRRGRVPRHRTMRAAIDWSYSLLGEDEQLFFRALGIFSGGFTVEAAAAVAMDSTTGCEAIERLADMVAKSLVVADVSGIKPRFRLLETTRAFAIEKLDESGKRQPVARRHATYNRQLFERAAAEAPSRATGDWLADYATDIDNLRAALGWTFSPDGEASIGVALTAAALPLWIRLSLLEECCRRTRQALGAASTENPREAMQLQAALGASTPEAPEMVAAFTKVLDVARRLDDVEYQLRALWGLYFYYTGIGRFRTAQPFALEFRSLSLRGSDRNDQMFGKSMVATAEHFVGDQASARRQLEQLLTQGAAGDLGRDVLRFRDVVRFGMDFRLQVTVFLARVLWLQGFADRAVRMAEQSLREADATGHAISQCFVLALASCPIAFWVGDQLAATRYTAKLVELSRQHALPHWAAFGARFEQVLVIKAGDGGSRRRPGGKDQKAAPNFSFRSLSGLTQLAEALGQAGRTTEGLAALETDVEQFEDGCFSPELIRLKVELTMQQDMPGAAGSAEALLRQALERAREQGALSWELRAATSLARLLHHQGRPAEAIACLQPVYNRFTEGFGTHDLIAAKQILDQACDPGAIQ